MSGEPLSRAAAGRRGSGTGADLPVGIAQASLGYLLGALGPYVVLLAVELDEPRRNLAWLTSVFGTGLVLIAVIGPLAMRSGAGRVLRAAAVAVGLGAAVMATVPVLPAAGAGVLLVGLGGAAIVLVTPALLRGVHAPTRLTRVNAASSTAGISAALAIGVLESFGAPGRLALLAPLPALLVLVLLRPPAPRPAPEGPSASTASPAPVGVASLLRRPVVAGWTRVVLAVSAEFCFLIWGVARIQDSGATVAAAAALSSAFPIGMALGRLAGTRVAGHPRVLAGGCLAAGMGTAVVYAGQAPWSVTLGLGIAGLGVAVLYPVALARLGAVPGLAPAHSASLGALASGTAILAAPSLLAAIDGVVGLRIAFLVPFVLLAALLALSLRVPRTGGPRP